ncbi:substrate-binding domain-containing protein [Dyella tabacisoli]|nr:substrate-binding domain-containing protein [Dyella tabacisoli]
MAYGYTGKNRMKTLAGAMFLGMITLASAAQASTTLVGGGATLPALGYTGDVTHRLTSSPVAGSFLAAYSAQTGNPATTYCQTGSGKGKDILAGVAGTNVQTTCPDGPTAPNGFDAGAAGRGTLTQPSFVGADSPLNSLDYSHYTTNRSGSSPLQFPAVAGSVAITFNKANVSSLALTDALVCKIFSGQISDWSDSQLAAAGVPAGVSGAINVIYRGDNSGTTFAFSNHLATICAGSASQHFITDQAFTNVVSKYQSTIPANWNAQSGNANLVAKVVALDGAIGYAETANVSNIFAQFATLNGLDPVADLTNSVTINSTDVVYNNVITGADATTGQATYAALSPLPSTSCIALVKPSAYANPSGYPIVAVSYLLGNSNGNGTDTANVRKLLGAPYNSAITGATTTIGSGTGLAFLSTSFVQSQIDTCVVN